MSSAGTGGGMKGSGVGEGGLGGGRQSYTAFLTTEGMEREMSHQGEERATPAGRAMEMSWLWKRMVVEVRWRVRSVWRRTMLRFAPAESPARMILLGGTGAWKDPGGGETR